MLPTVDFCGVEMTKMLIGANPFGGFSHQNKERDEQMRNYHTPERIIETWNRAWKAGINTFVTNNETKHVIETTKLYLKSPECKMNWIGQLSWRTLPSMEWAIDDAVAAGRIVGLPLPLPDAGAAGIRHHGGAGLAERIQQAVPLGGRAHLGAPRNHDQGSLRFQAGVQRPAGHGGGAG